MKIGFYKLGLNNAKVNTAFGGMYKDFFSAISKQPNYEVIYISDFKSINSVDIMVLTMGSGQESESCKVMNSFNGPVILYTPPAILWFKKSLLKRWSHKILFVYNTDESTYSQKKYKKIDIEYITLPFASDKNTFRPLNFKEKVYDVLFVGNAKSGTGRYMYTDKLIQKAKEKKWKILLIGSGWEKYGFPLQLIAHGELLNFVYNSSKISLNISNNEQKMGEDKCLDLNNRVFDLAMSGCFQISNAPQIIRKYFGEEEIFAVDDPNLWIDAIDKFLKDRGKREEMSNKAMVRALNLHTWEKRAEKLTEKINYSLKNFNKKKKIGLWKTFLRLVDCSGLYYLLFKAKIIIKILYSKLKKTS